MSTPSQPNKLVVDRRFVAASLLILFVGLLLFLRAAVIPGEDVPLVYVSVVSSGLALINAWHMFGWKPAGFLFLVSIVVGWTIEQLAIQYMQGTSGAYHYTDALGPRIGNVPVVIPLSWYTSIYCAYVITNLIMKGQYEFRTATWGTTLALSFLSAMVQTSWDLSLDPYMVNKLKAWVWTDGGPYFGIPIANYTGWIVLTMLVNLIYRKTNRFLPLMPSGHVPWGICFIPLAGYAMNMVGAVIAGYPDATRLIAFFAMGTPLAFAVLRLWFTNTGRG